MEGHYSQLLRPSNLFFSIKKLHCLGWLQKFKGCRWPIWICCQHMPLIWWLSLTIQSRMIGDILLSPCLYCTYVLPLKNSIIVIVKMLCLWTWLVSTYRRLPNLRKEVTLEDESIEWPLKPKLVKYKFWLLGYTLVKINSCA